MAMYDATLPHHVARSGHPGNAGSGGRGLGAACGGATAAQRGWSHVWRAAVTIAWWVLLTVIASLPAAAATGTARAQDHGAQQAEASAAAAPGGIVSLLRIDGAIGPATLDYLQRGLAKAAAAGARAVVVQIDTPGGLDSSTRAINKAILASPLPVIAWVAPGGARAASAGAYIMYASHVAAMAPGTNLGSATPVQMGGMPGSPRPTPPDDAAPPQDENTPAAPRAADGASAPRDGSDPVRPAAGAMTRKVVNDSAAYLRSLAQMRGRNGDWADRAVRDGVSLSASEALAQGVIDLIAGDTTLLLRAAHGREVAMGDGTVRRVDTAGARIVPIEADWRTELLAVITNPTVAYLLLLLGIYGIYFELTSPGFGVPGVAGAIGLLLGMFALQMMPVSYAGVALIVLGFVLLVAEAMMPSFGALGVGGIVAFVVGSVMLIDTDTPGFGIPPGLIAAVAVLNVAFVVVVLRMAIKATHRPVVSGSEELPGTRGTVTDVTGGGIAWARVHGERWRVAAARPLNVGDAVRVLGRDGLVLRVEPVDGHAAGPAPPPDGARHGAGTAG